MTIAKVVHRVGLALALVLVLVLVPVPLIEAQLSEQPLQMRVQHVDVGPGQRGNLVLPTPGAGWRIVVLAVDWIVCGHRTLRKDTRVEWTTTGLQGLRWPLIVYRKRGDWPNCSFYSSPPMLRAWPLPGDVNTTVIFTFEATPGVSASMNVYYGVDH